MNATELEESAGTDNADRLDVPMEQPDLEVYLPGTPTVSFIEYIELAVTLLIRR